jgi:hypothetical protein
MPTSSRSKARKSATKSAATSAPPPQQPKPTLIETFKALEKVLALYSPPLKLWMSGTKAKPHTRLTIPVAVVIPGIYSGKPIDLEVASLILGKGSVSFHFLPLYIRPALISKIPRALKKTLKGKTCFHIKSPDPVLLEDVRQAVDAGTQLYRDRGWL